MRLAYWIGLCLLGSLAGGAVTAAATSVRVFGERRWLVAVVVFVSLSALLTPVVWAVTESVFGDRLRPALIPNFALPVMIITAAMTTLTFLLNRAPVLTHASAPPRSASVSPAEDAPTEATCRFLDRLPAKLRGGTLYAVASEDHYLRLHTSAGQDLILMRLSDALNELDGLEGAQTHRSWWVARDSFTHVSRSDGRALLRLKNGVEAPVSRTFAKALRQAGWF